MEENIEFLKEKLEFFFRGKEVCGRNVRYPDVKYVGERPAKYFRIVGAKQVFNLFSQVKAVESSHYTIYDSYRVAKLVVSCKGNKVSGDIWSNYNTPSGSLPALTLEGKFSFSLE